MTAILSKLQKTAPSTPASNAMTFTYSPGSTPLPRYTIRRGIGIGGFGEVYFAISEAGKEVALKRIQRNLDVELRGVSHCLNLKHPNLVSLFDICRDANEESWVVMEYVAGKNLRQVLDESPTGLTESEARRWFAAIAAGVHHLHAAGLVHRDLKPGNVFDDLGIVKVGDYGLSKFISSSHRAGHTESVGTFHYMAPEIGRGEYGREIDIYALGIMLYEVLTGMVPFDGESSHEIIIKHMTAEPNLTLVGEPYRSVIAKCLEKDPQKRFRSTVDLTDALGMSRPDNPVLSGSPGLPGSRVDEPPADSANSPYEEPIMASLSSANSNPRSYPSPLANHPPSRAHESTSDLQRWWRSLDQSPGAKFFLVLGIVLVTMTAGLWPLLMLAAIVYVPYYVVRQMVPQVNQQPRYAGASSLQSNAACAQSSGRIPATTRPLSKSEWRSQCRKELCAKPRIHRVAELSTSWMTACLTTFVLAVVAGVIGLGSGPTDAAAVAPYAAMAMIVLVSSLAMLWLGKYWERDEGESLPRRLVLAGVGVFVGAFAYAVTQFLMLPLDYGLTREIDSTTLPQALYLGNKIPRASALMTHFALLFAALRWWKPVDPLRRRRLSLWSVAVAVVSEWAVHQILPIPQPAGMLIAGGIAIAVQMSSPWLNPRPKTILRKTSLATAAAAMFVLSTASMTVHATEVSTEAAEVEVADVESADVESTKVEATKVEAVEVEVAKVEAVEVEVAETQAKSTELSVVPLDQTVYPSDRPDWIDRLADDENPTAEEDYTVVVTSLPSETREESAAGLQLMKRAAVLNTIKSFVPRGRGIKSDLLDDDWIDHWLVQRTYEGEVTKGDMVLHEHAAELVFDKEARDEIRELWKRVQLRNRLGFLGLAGFGGFCLLVMSSVATGFLSRRLSLRSPSGECFRTEGES
ncbi:Serine/threonine-protein kinase PrkC [Novipirellula aureliae]|uniref:Serine/threonine-protein kinase PrkC n=1 Tax=Novipirellula aureliae TaxID=2527966 RepID=A0A5C6DWY9_9BACT|nr:serine/threonine-protein kinase [Novipirellula aureliae]TWU41260.1 Serine/threonine-protein kinase PrkC [Novipirellula aureliae]